MLPSAVTGPTGSTIASPFPAEEYDARLRRVREAMDEGGVAMLLVASPENVYYLLGLDHLGYFAFTLLILPREGQPMLVARAMERPTVELQSPQSLHLPYDDREDPADTVIGALRRLGPIEGRVGVERSTMYFPVDVWERVRGGLADLRWVDASELVAGVSMVKSPRELDHVRRAAAASDRALRTGLATADEGVTEREVAAAVYAELITAGTGAPGVPPLVRSTPNLKLEHVTWSDRSLGHGDSLFLELSASVNRYHAPLSRVAYVGEPPAGLHEVADHALAGWHAVRAALRPGATADDVYEAWQRAVDAALGHSRYRRHHCGYMTGIGFPPSWWGGSTPVALRAGNHLELREGMLFHAFSWILGQGPVDYAISDTMVVTAGGCEVLTSTIRQPTITGAHAHGLDRADGDGCASPS